VLLALHDRGFFAPRRPTEATLSHQVSGMCGPEYISLVSQVDLSLRLKRFPQITTITIFSNSKHLCLLSAHCMTRHCTPYLRDEMLILPSMLVLTSQYMIDGRGARSDLIASDCLKRHLQCLIFKMALLAALSDCFNAWLRFGAHLKISPSIS